MHSIKQLMVPIYIEVLNLTSEIFQYTKINCCFLIKNWFNLAENGQNIKSKKTLRGIGTKISSLLEFKKWVGNCQVCTSGELK